MPVVVAVIVYFICIAPGQDPTVPFDDGRGHIALLRANTTLPRPDAGGPSGRVWYSPTGTPFQFALRASGLDASSSYDIALLVDGTRVAVGNRTTTHDGELALDTTLQTFGDEPCQAAGHDPCRALRGTHSINFRIIRSRDQQAVLRDEIVARYNGGP